ncbi:exocyst complex component 1-like isoform X2 [Gigantopelta aegis]|nr:exocyst complex component 1-like isoform X2 [Gigantopelta aegis]
MATIKHLLQQEVFLRDDERLVGVISVSKPSKKKKTSYLCAVLNTTETPIRVCVYVVKKADRGDAYKKQLSWLLKELRVVDGKNSDKEMPEFDLHFEKVYKWVASCPKDRDSFISCLWRLSRRYLIQKPDFVNISEDLLIDITQPQDPSEVSKSVDDLSIEEDYQALTSKEETDLELLMSECAVAISNAEAFAEQLGKQLSVLDGANIHSIMGSEDQVLNLMRLLDDGINEAERIERKLDSYDNILVNVKEQMEVMKEKDRLMRIRNTNHQCLLEELNSLVSQLDLDMKHISALCDGDLASPGAIYECTAAAQALHKCMNAKIHAGLLRMGAVEEQHKRFNKLAANFSKRLAHHLNNLFIHQGNEIEETWNHMSSELSMPNHDVMHRELVVYADLMHWLKDTDSSIFNSLCAVYHENLCKLYTKEISEFLENAKQKMIAKPDKSGKHSATLTPKLSGSATSLGKLSDLHLRGRSSSVQSMESANFLNILSVHLDTKGLFDQILETVLGEMERVCIAEQDFCVRFFHLVEKAAIVESKDEDEDQEVWTLRTPPKLRRKSSIILDDYFVENLGQGLMQKRSTSHLRQINDTVRVMMAELFPTLDTELNGFLAFADKQDSMYSMFMLVRMSQHVINTQDMGSFLSLIFGNCLIKVKRNFDNHILAHIKGIEEAKISKKTRCGIIIFVHNFEDFANFAETIFKGSDRHTDLDKAYAKLVNVIFEQIERVANEHVKTPPAVIMMENYHRMFSILSQLKIASLESEKKKAKQLYTENLHQYTTNLLGRPLEKLHIFFEGVEAQMAKGVKAEEVGFQLAFSKQELRKVIKEYTPKEIKKIFEHMYKKVEKQLCEEENLLQ